MSLTSIEGRLAPGMSTLVSFADITDARLMAMDRNGLLFEGELTDAQVEAIWWRATSRDAADEIDRRAIEHARATGALNLCDITAAYVLGMSLPEPQYPEPAPTEQTVTATVSKVAAPSKSSRK